MRFSFFKTRYIGYLVLLALVSWFLFNYLINSQSAVMYKYFIEKPTSYNLERAERLASSIYQSFKTEITNPTIKNITAFINKYNDIPFLSVNFLYRDDKGVMKSVLRDVKEIDILSAEYVYPIKWDNRDIGTLIIYDINKEYKKGLKEYDDLINLMRTFFAIMLLLLLSILVYREYSSKIEQAKKEAEYQAVHDGLTGLYTQKYFKKHLNTEISRCFRYKHPISLIMCDVDHFKHFNDTYGHLMGDKVLSRVAQIISDNVRISDIVARYGGEEFAVILIETGLEEAQSVANRLKDLTDQALEIAGRIKSRVEKTRLKVDDHTETKVTISMGISSYDGEDKDYKAEYLISTADHALYQSKERGRNKITLYNHSSEEFITFDQ